MPRPPVAVKEILLAELHGTRVSNKKLKRVSVSIQLEILELDGDERAVMQRGRFTATDASDADGSDTPEFTALVTYFVALEEPYADSQAAGIAEVMWPYVRSAVNDLAARMGVPYVKLPVSIDESTLEADLDASTAPDAQPSESG